MARPIKNRKRRRERPGTTLLLKRDLSEYLPGSDIDVEVWLDIKTGKICLQVRAGGWVDKMKMDVAKLLSRNEVPLRGKESEANQGSDQGRAADEAAGDKGAVPGIVAAVPDGTTSEHARGPVGEHQGQAAVPNKVRVARRLAPSDAALRSRRRERD